MNTKLLREQGWNVTYFDAAIENAEIGIRKVTLTEENIAASFRAAGVPTQVDYVSIDVDSIDVWLMRALLLGSYRPRVISIEFNINFPASMHVVHERQWHAWSGRSVFGSSAGAINHVASAAGYRLVHLMPSGLDMFFVRKDLLAKHCHLNSIPSFGELAGPHLGRRHHGTCSATEDLPRLVDMHLELLGQHKEAQLLAVAHVKKLNSLNPTNPMCHMPI